MIRPPATTAPLSLVGLRGWLASAAFLLLASCASAPAAAPPTAPPDARVPVEAGGIPADTVGAALAPASPAPREAPASWHLLDAELDGVEGASVTRAKEDILAGRRPERVVVVAIIDSGVDTTHVALRPRLWQNPGERGGTGLDDDGNGYADDVRGWNFLGAPDGASVAEDTWEVTRLHALCTTPEAAPVAPPPLPDPQTCASVSEDFEARVAEARGFLANVEGIARALETVVPMLERAVGDSLTPTNVTALVPRDRQVQEARSFYLQLAELGATPADVRDAMDELRTQLAFKLNPEFDPRPTVGDDYTDSTQRLYGNPDVVGPDASHGTHVAGIVTSVFGDDAEAGVRIMSIRAVPDGDERDKDIANAIRYAVDNGAHVINMSFGKDYSPQKAVVDAAVRYADERGVLLVHAAGNEGRNLADGPAFPSRDYLDGGAAALWLEVGASSWRGADTLVAPFSNYGQDQVDLFAPGVDIMSTVPGGGFETNSGTSMAAPLVAGVAALIMAYFPDLTAADVRDILLETATRHRDRVVILPGDPMDPEIAGVDPASDSAPFQALSRSGGVLNARAALQRAAELAGRDPARE
ncbi:S8 family peptidase [soil metagenome]